MKAQDILNEIEAEEKQIQEHRRERPDGICFEVIQEMTPKEINNHQEFFNIQEEQEIANENVSFIFGLKPKHEKIKQEIMEILQ